MIRSPKWLVLAALVSASPDTPGVYELWDGEKLLCVSATHGGTLREELMRLLLRRDARATHFSWEISFAPERREQELIAELASGGNDSPRGSPRA